MHPSPSFLPTFDAAKTEYEAAWDDLTNTRFELPPVDVNKVLRTRYKREPDRRLTRALIWDMETKKAWDPLSFIPYVVSEGDSWDRRQLQDGSYRFCRASVQKGWIRSDGGRVLEDVYVSDAKQAIYFMGRDSIVAADGSELKASKFQPIFHVYHGVGGTEDEPQNLWSIVFLTNQNDSQYEAPFEEMIRVGLLPGFIEIYIRNNLGVKLSKT